MSSVRPTVRVNSTPSHRDRRRRSFPGLLALAAWIAAAAASSTGTSLATAAGSEERPPAAAPSGGGASRPAGSARPATAPGGGRTAGAADPALLARADSLYYDHRVAEALALYEQIRRAAPADPVLAYKIFWCLDRIPGKAGETAKARERAQALLEKAVEAKPEPITAYYLANLVDDDDEKRASRLREAEIERHLPEPDPALGFMPLLRLAMMASREDRPADETAAFVRAALQADGGVWRDSPRIDDLADLILEVGDKTGTLAEFARQFDVAIAARPKSAELRAGRARLLLASGHRDRALKDLDAALALAPESPRALLALGSELIRVDRDAEAVPILERAVARAPLLVAGWHKLGVARLVTGRPEEAAKAFREVLRLEPDDPRATLYLGHAMAGQARPDEAEPLYRKALEKQPGDPEARWALASLLEESGHLQQALDAIDAPDLDGEPDQNLSLVRVRVLWRMDRNGEAVKAAERALKRWPEHVEIRRTQAHAFEDRAGRGDLERALEIHRRLAEAERDSPVPSGDMARLLWRLEQRDEALRLIGSTLKAHPKYVYGWKLRAEILASREETRMEALKVLEAGTRAVPDALDLWLALGTARSALGQHVPAVAALRRAVEIEPRSVQAVEALCFAQVRASQFDDAAATLERALEKMPKEARLHQLRGVLLNQLGRGPEALASVETAVKLSPGDSSTHHSLAAVLHSQGKTERALSEWDRALEIDPKFESARRARAEALEEAGQVEAALSAWLDLARDLPADEEIAARVAGLRRRLERGESADVRALDRAIPLHRQEGAGGRALPGLPPDRAGAPPALDGPPPTPLALDPLDARQALARFDPAMPIFKDQPAAHVLDFLQMEIRADGSSTQTYHGMLRVLDEKAVEAVGEIRIPFQAGRERLQVHTARTHLPGGRTVDADPGSFHRLAPTESQTANVYSDAQIEVVSMPAVRVGATLEWRYTVQGQKSLFDGHWWKQWAFDAGIPNALSRFVLRVPAGLDFTWKALNIDLKPQVREENGSRIYTWTAARRPAAPREPGSPPFADTQAQIQISSMKSWDEVGRWYHDLSRDRYVLDHDLEDEVGPALAGARTPEEKARRLSDFVRQRIRYVGIEFGAGGYQPRPAGEVLHTAFGDCKDQVTLLVTLLRRAGVEAHPALVRTQSRRPLDTWPPSPGVFDHAITYLPGIRGGTFVDTTAPGMAFGDLPPHVQWSEALVARAEGPLRLRVPMLPPSATRLRNSRTVDLTRPQSAAFADRSDATGLFAQILHLEYGRLDPQEQARRVASDVHRDFPAATDLAMDVSGAREPAGKSAVVQTYRVPGLLQPLGQGQHLLSLEDSEEVAQILEVSPEATRTQPYLAPLLFTVEYQQNVKLPAGWTVESHPQPVRLGGPGGTYEKQAQAIPGGLRVTSRFVLSEAEIPLDRYAPFASFVRSVARNQTWNIVLREPPARAAR